MAIAIDASTPAAVGVDSGNATTGAFTAPAGSLLVAFANVGSLSGGASVGPAIADSGSLTWTKIASGGPNADNEEAVAWWASPTTAASRTVTVSGATNTANKFLQVVVFTGADTARLGHVAYGAPHVDGVLSASTPCMRTGSWLWCAYADRNKAAAPTAAGGSTVRSSATTSAMTSACVYTTATGTRGTDMTVATSAPAGARVSYVAVEILPSVTASGRPAPATSVALGGNAGTDVTGAGVSWTTLPAQDVESISIRHGFAGEIEDTTPGRATIILDNYSGAYDPVNTGSAYYPDLTLGKPVQVVAPWGGTDYARLRMFIADIVLDPSMGPKVRIELVDSLDQLGQAGVGQLAQPAYDGDRTGTRIGRILDAVGIPSGARRVETGQSRLQATAYGDRALALIQPVVSTEIGWFFVAGDGEIRFNDRYHVLTDALSTTVRATFTDAGTDIDIESLTLSGLSTSVYNEARLKRDAPPPYGFSDPNYPAGWVSTPAEQTATDTTSATAYGTRTYPVAVGKLCRSDGDTRALAQWLVRRYKTPQVQLEQVTCDAFAQGQWTSLLELDLLHRVRVVRSYGAPTPVSVDRQALILGITEEITQTSWRFTFDLVDVSRLTQDRFVLNESRLGPTGGGKLGY